MAEETKAPTQEQLLTDWLRISIERFQKAIEKSGISMSRKNLFDSFTSEMRKGGDSYVQSVLLKFRFHGRFVDMGVGRGVPIGSQANKLDYFKYRNKKGQLNNYGRTPKKWYSKTLGAQTKKLSELLAENFGIKAISVLENNMKQNIEINLNP